MAEGRMAEIVHQGQRFGEIDVKSEGGRDGARDLRDFNGVREPVAEVVGIAARENLRFYRPGGERRGAWMTRSRSRW